MNAAREHIVDIQLDLLPGYADFLLTNKLDEYVKTLANLSHELEVPLLKFFEGMTEQEVLKLSIDSNTRLLNALKTRSVLSYLEETRFTWMRNQLPVISKEDIIVEDISLINYARKRALREYLPLYTENKAEVYKILDEIDRFIMCLESIYFKTYLTIQQEKLNESNTLLKRRESELLEAQSLAKIGSFEWDLTGNKNSRYTPEVFKIFEFEETTSVVII